MMHILGFSHEQSRSDQALYFYKYIVRCATIDLSQSGIDSNTNTQFPYDYKSIMQYSTALMKSSGGSNSGYCFLPTKMAQGGFKAGINEGYHVIDSSGLSDIDKAKVRLTYGCDIPTSNPCQNNGVVIDSKSPPTCVCQEYYSGTKCENFEHNRDTIVGGGDSDLFISCDTSSLKCVGTKSDSKKTKFRLVYVTTNTVPFFQYRPRNSNLCLAEDGGKIVLKQCQDPENRNSDDSMLWVISTTAGTVVYPLRNAKNQNIWWDGDGKELKSVSGCGAWQCWHWHPWQF
jgi:hypothetical protein